jgi:soluble lytic murein transglycosylase-like protein
MKSECRMQNAECRSIPLRLSSFFILHSSFFILVACTRTAPAPPPPPAPTPPAVVEQEQLPATLDEARALRVAGKLETYEHALRALTASPDARTRGRALALLALVDLDQKKNDEALAMLARAADDDAPAAPWLRLRIVEVARDSGRYAEAIAAANRIVQENPTSAAATVARLRLPALYAISGDAAATDAAFKDASTITIDELTEEELVALATELAKAGRQDLAADLRMRLLTQFPQGRYTEQTYGYLTMLPTSPIDALPFNDALALAQRLAAQDRYDQALNLLGRIGQRFPQTSKEYRAVRIRALFNSRKYDLLLNETEDVKLNDPSLMLLRARAAWRADRDDEFLAGLKQVEKGYPSSAAVAEARLMRAKYYTTDDPKLDLALRNLEEAVGAGAVGNEGENIWTLGWTYVLARRYDDALRTFDDYARKYPDGDYLTNTLFWTAKVQETLGHTQERDATFAKLWALYPYSYYSYRAREIMRLPTTAPSEISNGNVFPDLEAAVAAVPDRRIDSVRELMWLDLPRDASREMKAVAAAYPDNPGIAFMLADVYVDGGEPLKANNFLQRRFRPFVRHGGSGVPRRFWQILFPLNNWEAIRAEAEKRQIDPYLIASIIRQESGFEPTVVSNAGAVGIMQIMPEDAARVAAAAGLPAPRREELFDPKVNIPIGVAEYAQKLSVMQNNAVLAIAAYNAGEEAVGRWVAATAADDVDLFVESIPYNETRLYVKSVTRNRYEYRRIYEGISTSQ